MLTGLLTRLLGLVPSSVWALLGVAAASGAVAWHYTDRAAAVNAVRAEYEAQAKTDIRLAELASQRNEQANQEIANANRERERLAQSADAADAAEHERLRNALAAAQQRAAKASAATGRPDDADGLRRAVGALASLNKELVGASRIAERRLKGLQEYVARECPAEQPQ